MGYTSDIKPITGNTQPLAASLTCSCLISLMTRLDYITAYAIVPTFKCGWNHKESKGAVALAGNPLVMRSDCLSLSHPT